MKTTIDIPDALFNRTKALAHKHGLPMRDLIIEGVVQILKQKEAVQVPKIQPVTFKGEGLTPEFAEGCWTALRDTIYEGRGT